MAFHDDDDDGGPSLQEMGRNTIDLIMKTLVAPFERREGGPGGWWLASGKRYRFRAPVTSRRMEEGPLHTMSPSIAGWWRDRLPSLPEEEVVEKTPDWVCLVEDQRSLFAADLEVHEAAGVRHAWTVDPLAKTLAVYTRQRAKWSEPQVYGVKSRLRFPPFEAIEIEVASLWGT